MLADGVGGTHRVRAGPQCIGYTSVYINGTLSTSSKAELAPTVANSAYIKVRRAHWRMRLYALTKVLDVS